jgi:hypothetical protein
LRIKARASVARFSRCVEKRDARWPNNMSMSHPPPVTGTHVPTEPSPEDQGSPTTGFSGIHRECVVNLLRTCPGLVAMPVSYRQSDSPWAARAETGRAAASWSGNACAGMTTWAGRDPIRNCLLVKPSAMCAVEPRGSPPRKRRPRIPIFLYKQPRAVICYGRSE